MSMPLTFLLAWVAGLVSLLVLGLGGYLVWAWYTGALVATIWLVLGVLLLAWALAGRCAVVLMRRRGEDEPRAERTGRHRTVKGPSGAVLHVEEYGPEQGAPTLVLTHGWDLDATAWHYQKRHLAGRFRLVLWDLPGLGRSSQPEDGGYSLERMAGDLKAVVDATSGGRPVVLVGHSIGGMIGLTFCRLYPEVLGREVAGLALMNTTHTMPLNTIYLGGLLRALRGPVLVPLLHLTTWIWPVVWLMNIKSYLDGSAHSSTAWSSFSGQETRGQLDFAARFTAKQHPGVLAKGILAMLRWDETETLPAIPVPVLAITGDQDKLTRPEAGQHIGQAVPIGQVTPILPAGHAGLLEQNAQYDAVLAAFAEQCFSHDPNVGVPKGGVGAAAWDS